ncbi:hypothetical protein [Clostridium sp. DL1XJH146]
MKKKSFWDRFLDLLMPYYDRLPDDEENTSTRIVTNYNYKKED